MRPIQAPTRLRTSMVGRPEPRFGHHKSCIIGRMFHGRIDITVNRQLQTFRACQPIVTWYQLPDTCTMMYSNDLYSNKLCKTYINVCHCLVYSNPLRSITINYHDRQSCDVTFVPWWLLTPTLPVSNCMNSTTIPTTHNTSPSKSTMQQHNSITKKIASCIIHTNTNLQNKWIYHTLLYLRLHDSQT